MKAEQKEFFDTIDSFRKLKLNSILPGITHGDSGILNLIYCCRERASGEGIKISDLVRESQLPPPAISRSLRALESKGLVTRTVDPQDRRNTFVILTPAGEEMREEVDKILSDLADAIFGTLGDETVQKLIEYLKSFLEASRIEIERRKYEGRKGERE